MINFSVDQSVLDLGVKIKTALIFGVNNQPSDVIKDFVDAEIKKLNFQPTDQILAGFQDLHSKVGRSSKDYVSSPENLISFITRKGQLPQINPIVDLYNLVSVKSKLALGAHDISKITGNVSLKITSGVEKFVPLGKSDLKFIPSGEYGYVDDDNNIICRLEVIQCDKTKVTVDTKDIFIIIQGNTKTTRDYVDRTAIEVCELITKFCGGSYTILN